MSANFDPSLLPPVYGRPNERDVVGYGAQAPDPKWPNGAKVALSLVLNYEEGAESCLLHGDSKSEHLLSEIVGAAALPGERHANMESLYDYGSRAGFWRLHRLLTSREVPCTVFACGAAMERNPEAVRAMVSAGWEVASHGYRWLDYQDVDEKTEREHIAKTVDVHRKLVGKPPAGMYQGKPNVHTRRYVVEQDTFFYDCDSYADDLPYWTHEYGYPHLILPYTLSENDMRFAIPNGFSHAGEFFTFLKDSLDYMLEEGRNGAPRMMSVGLHCRLVGRPGRAAGLARFLDYAKTLPGVWITTREQIARHWFTHHWPGGVAKSTRILEWLGNP